MPFRSTFAFPMNSNILATSEVVSAIDKFKYAFLTCAIRELPGQIQDSTLPEDYKSLFPQCFPSVVTTVI